MNLTYTVVVLICISLMISVTIAAGQDVDSLRTDNKALESELLTYEISVAGLEGALEQAGLARDEVIRNYNDCLKANPDYWPYEFKIDEDGKVWWRMKSDGEWKLQGTVDSEHSN